MPYLAHSAVNFTVQAGLFQIVYISCFSDCLQGKALSSCIPSSCTILFTYDLLLSIINQYLVYGIIVTPVIEKCILCILTIPLYTAS